MPSKQLSFLDPTSTAPKPAMDLHGRLAALKASYVTPLTDMPLPDPEESQRIVTGVVEALAIEQGKQPDEVIVPRAIPECFGFHEEADPACKPCPYKVDCTVWQAGLYPKCFKRIYPIPACLGCMLIPWCSINLKIS